MIVKPAELMVCAAAREIKNTDVVIVGTRLPLLAFFLAKSTHAPQAVGLFESGLIRDDPALDFIMTMCDPPNVTGATVCTSLRGIMGHLQQGRVTVGFLGGAEVDVFGNLNTTRAGTVRLPGSGGGADAACLAGRLVIMMTHQRRRLVKRVQYMTSPGWGDGPGWREDRGLEGGPSALVTTLGLFRFHPQTKRAVLTQVHPEVDLEAVRRETGWHLEVAQDLRVTPLPTLAELALIRRFDPLGFWTGRKQESK
ncbi:MAG: CoA-transferase [Proteobacteria bacterium]|nr:CoA-transferase [Pseudomonadota bacterium]